MPTSVLLDISDGIATITLNRPQAGNSLDREAMHALMMAAIAVDEDAAVKCVVLTGAGKLFCAGGDVPSFIAAGDELPSLLKEITVYLNAAVSRLARMEKPLIVAVNGAAAGAGLGLALLGDLVIASNTATFTTAYTAIGLSPDGGVSWMLPRLMGLRAAQEMAILNLRVTAEEAAQKGLVTRVVPADELLEQTRTLALQVSGGPELAIGSLRALFLSSGVQSLETHLELEARSISRMSATQPAKTMAAALVARMAAKAG